MLTNEQLDFLRQKILDTGTAIFFNLSDSVLKFPTTVVHTLKVDDYGFVWFLVQKPKQDIKEFETGFPVRLDYYRKGIHYFLQVTGKAWIVSDPEEMNLLAGLLEDVQQKSVENMVLVKVKMLSADYHEIPVMTNGPWWQSALHSIHIWFRHIQGVYKPETSLAS